MLIMILVILIFIGVLIAINRFEQHVLLDETTKERQRLRKAHRLNYLNEKPGYKGQWGGDWDNPNNPYNERNHQS